jgi:hypothetical protein
MIAAAGSHEVTKTKLYDFSAPACIDDLRSFSLSAQIFRMHQPKWSSAFWRVRRIADTRLAIRRASATKARAPIFQELIDFQMRTRGKAPGVNQDAPRNQD